MSAIPFRRLLGVTTAALLLVSAGCGGHGPKVQHGDIEVFYKDGATKEEADRLGAYLVKAWAGAEGRRSVQIKKAGDGYQFRMVVKKEFQNDDKTLQSLAFDAARISRDALDGAAVELHACDENLKTVKVLPPRTDVRYGIVDGKVEVFYPTEKDKADAQRLAKHLVPMLAAAPGAVTFKLARRGDIVEVHMVIQKELVNDPALVAGWRANRADLAANVFKGAAVELHLSDEHLNVLREIKE